MGANASRMENINGRQSTLYLNDIYFFFMMMLLLHYGKFMCCVSFSVRRTIVVPVCASKVEKAMRRGCVVPKIQRVCFSDASRQMYVNVLAGLKK